MDTDVVVVGAGLAGLAVALDVADAGLDCVVLEAADRPGGRVRTDVVDGFRLDRGFQVLLTAYPELRRRFGDLAELDVRRFLPGAAVQLGGRRHRVADPLRRPGAVVSSALAPVGSPLDKLRLLRLIADVRRGSPAALLRRPDMSTAERLRQAGFTEGMVERFWRPLIGGIELDPTLSVSRRRFDVVLRMLAAGDAGVPALGVGRVPELLADRLGAGVLRCGEAVARIEGTRAVLAGGGRVGGRALVVATEGPAAATLLGLDDPGSLAAACCWFVAPEPPLDQPELLLDGDRSGPVWNLAPMSVVAPEYSPDGRALVAAAVPGPGALSPGLEADATSQMRRWFGPVVDRWELLRTDVIPHGQPAQLPPFSPKRTVRLGGGRYVCGDHRDTGSTQGALYSGRRAAAAVVADLRAA